MPKAKYQLISDLIRRRIASGELRAGDRLLPQRAFSEQHGVTLGTVSRAYNELIREGVLEATIGRGTFVRSSGCVESPNEGVIDLRVNRPPVRLLVSDLIRSLGEAPDSFGAALTRDEALTLGSAAHRHAAGEWCRERYAYDAARSSLVLCSGAQQGLMAALMACTRPGDTVLTEKVTYVGVMIAARALGLSVVGVAMDEEGVCPIALSQCVRDTNARVLVCTPTFHSPTSITMPLARRQAIIALAQRHDLTLLEDDAYGALAMPAMPSLFSLARERTLLFTSFSKTLAPGIRAGMLLAPARLGPVLYRKVRAVAWNIDPLSWAVLSHWLSNGTAQRAIEDNRKVLIERGHIARQVLEGCEFRTDEGCPHLWLTLPTGLAVSTVAASLQAEGVHIQPANDFSVDESYDPGAIRISLGAPSNIATLRKGLLIIRRKLMSPNRYERLIV